MGWYTQLHTRVKNQLARELKTQGHEVIVEARRGVGAVFDVYDATTDTAYEVLTAKFVRSGHEQDENFISKMFRYLLYSNNLEFVIASYDHFELPVIHSMKLRHWHYRYNWQGKFLSKQLHAGRDVKSFTHGLYHEMSKLAPLKEWTQNKRRKRHPYPVPIRVQHLEKKLGLPENFLKGMWRDWRLKWVLELERLLPKWEKRFRARSPAKKS